VVQVAVVVLRAVLAVRLHHQVKVMQVEHLHLVLLLVLVVVVLVR
jgi:hypothetical protein